MTDYLQAETTAGSRDEAAKLAEAMVRQRLAACAQIVGPIISTFWWEGDVQTEEEWLVLFKTSRDLAGAFKQALGEIHSYDVPEILLFEISDGARSYLDWITGETQAAAT